MARFFRRYHIGVPIGAGIGSLLGALVGCAVAGLNRKHLAELAQVAAIMKFELHEQAAEERIAPFRKAFHDVSFSRPRNLMLGSVEGCDVSVLDCSVFRTVGGYKGWVSTTVVLLTGDEPDRLPELDLIPYQVTVPAPMNPLLGPLVTCVARLFHSRGGSPVDRRFQTHYTLQVFGRPATPDLMQRVPEALAYFAQDQGWTVRAHSGHLLIWDDSESECAAKRRPDLVKKALEIRCLLEQAARANRDTAEVSAALQ